MSEKEQTLSSIFGNEFKPVSHLDQNGSIPTLKQVPSDKTKEYSKLKKAILNQLDGNEYKHPFIDWLNDNNPLSVCFVAKSLEEPFKELLSKRVIPFIAVKKLTKTFFIFRNCDDERFKKCIGDIIATFGSAPVAYNYQDFSGGEVDLFGKDFYLKNLSEEQMEFLRRNFASHGGHRQYAMFRMRNKWCMGFSSDTLNVDKEDGSEKVALLEDILYSSIALNGKNAEYYINRLKNDVAVDRLKCDNFNFSLRNNPNVFIYNPEFPKKAVMVTNEGFQTLTVSVSGGYLKLNESPFKKFGTKLSENLFRKEISSFAHKKMVYSSKAFLMAYSEWSKRDKKEEKRRTQVEEQERLFANILYNSFVSLNKNKDWFYDLNKPLEQVNNFKSYTSQLFTSFYKHEIPPFFNIEDADFCYSLINFCGLTPTDLDNIKKEVENYNFDKINVPVVSKNLKEKLYTLQQPER